MERDLVKEFRDYCNENWNLEWYFNAIPDEEEFFFKLNIFDNN